MPSRTVMLLALSLVLNAVLLGLVLGREAGHRAPPTAKMEFERYGPTSDVVRAAWSELPEADRVELRSQIRALYSSMAPDRTELHEAGNAVYTAALAQPFDERSLRDALVLFQHRERSIQQRLEDLLIRHLGKMPPAARATAAVGLLTPFNARIQRVDVGEREAQAMRADLQTGPGRDAGRDAPKTVQPAGPPSTQTDAPARPPS